VKKTLRCFQGKLLYFWFMYMGDFEQDMVLMNIIIATVVICMDFSMLILLKLKFKRDFDNEYSLCSII